MSVFDLRPLSYQEHCCTFCRFIAGLTFKQFKNMVVGNKMTNEKVEIFAPSFIKRDKGL